MNVEEGLVVAALIAVAVLTALVSLEEHRRWEQFKSAHDCKVLTHERGGVTTGYAGGDVVVLSSPDRTTWRCDDGVIYTR